MTLKMMMTNTNLNILKALVIADMLLIAVTTIFFSINTLWSTQIGFLSSTLVIVASIAAYKRMVDVRVEHNVITYDDSKDVIDQLEDPYDLYTEDILLDDEKDFVEVVKEERTKLNNNRSVFQTIKDTKAALSVYRLGAYAVLVLGFLYLNRHGLLHIPSYILALGIPPIVIVGMLLREKETQTEDRIQ